LTDGSEINNRFGEGVYGPRDDQRKSIPMGNLSTIFLAEVMAILKYTEILVSNPLNPELNPICYLLALLGAHSFLHVSRIRVKLLNFRLLMSYIYGAPILDVSRSHTTTQHSR